MPEWPVWRTWVEQRVVKQLGTPLLLLLIAISAVGPFALNGVLPATSAIIDDLATRYEVVQLVLTIFLVASLLSQLVLGPAADRYGRRPIMLGSLLTFVAGSLICASANSIDMLLAGRFVQGVGAAVCVFLPRSIVRDIHGEARAASVIGYMTTAMMVAPLFGPAIGGWITDTASWRFMYLGLAVLGAILFAAAYRYQRETLASVAAAPGSATAGSGQSMFNASAVLLKNPVFLACICMQAGAVGVYYSFLSGAPYVAMESRGLSASTYGIWFSMVAVGYLSGNLTAGSFSERFGVHRMILAGFVPFMLGVLLFWLLLPFEHPIGLFLPMLIVAFSNGMSLPSMFSAAMSIRPDLAASASGLAGSAQTAFGVILTLIIGYALPFGDTWLFVFITVSAVLSVVGMIWMARLRRRRSLPVQATDVSADHR